MHILLRMQIKMKKANIVLSQRILIACCINTVNDSVWILFLYEDRTFAYLAITAY